MIKIIIKSENEKIVDHLEKADITLNEVGAVLLKLEQIKQHLISLEFESLFEYNKEAENGN